MNYLTLTADLEKKKRINTYSNCISFFVAGCNRFDLGLDSVSSDVDDLELETKHNHTSSTADIESKSQTHFS